MRGTASSSLDDRNTPAWLRDIAIYIDGLVKPSDVMTRFRQGLRTWKNEHERRGPKLEASHRGRRHNPVELIPTRRMTLAEAFALLAAIHDEVCVGARRIDPWRTGRGWRGNMARVRSGTSYAHLCSQVYELDDADKARVCAALRAVCADRGHPAPARLATQDHRQRGSAAPRVARLRLRRPLPQRTELLAQPSASQDRPAAPPPAAVGSKPTDRPAEPPPRARKAWSQYQKAVEGTCNPELTDNEAYEWLKCKAGHEDEANHLPSFDTWRRNLSEYRRLTDQRKHEPRAGRAQGARSIRKRSEL